MLPRIVSIPVVRILIVYFWRINQCHKGSCDHRQLCNLLGHALRFFTSKTELQYKIKGFVVCIFFVLSVPLLRKNIVSIQGQLIQMQLFSFEWTFCCKIPGYSLETFILRFSLSRRIMSFMELIQIFFWVCDAMSESPFLISARNTSQKVNFRC